MTGKREKPEAIVSKLRQVELLQGRAEEERLTGDIIELADKYGRDGYSMKTGLQNNPGWCEPQARVADLTT